MVPVRTPETSLIVPDFTTSVFGSECNFLSKAEIVKSGNMGLALKVKQFLGRGSKLDG